MGSSFYGFNRCSPSIDLSGSVKGVAGGNSHADMEQTMVNMNPKELGATLPPFACGDVFCAVRTRGAEGQARGRAQMPRGGGAP